MSNKNSISYRQVGDFLIPNLTLPPEQANIMLGKWGNDARGLSKADAPLLQELIDHIDVYETEGKGKSRTQRIAIYYRFAGYIEIPDSAFKSNYTANIHQASQWNIFRKPFRHDGVIGNKKEQDKHPAPYIK